MKNFLITAIAVISLASCNNDDDNANGQAEVLLPQSGTDTDEDGTITSTCEYEGNKLKKITWSDDTYQTYTYENGKLQETDYYMEGNLVVKKTFTYNGNKLASVSAVDYEFEFEDLHEYTYNSNTSVTVKEYSRDLEEGEDSELSLNATGVLTLTNGNITKFVRTYNWGDVETYTYTFDDKHSPYSNIFATDILMLAELEGGKNNYLSYTFSDAEGGGTITYNNTYNTEGYLIKAVSSGGTSATINY